MPMKWIAVALLLAGILVLLYALAPTRRLCRDHAGQSQSLGWKVLYSMVGLFILGYLVFTTYLLRAPVSNINVVLAVLLFAGSCFVLLVSRMSMLSIREVKRIAALERHHALHDELTNLPNRTLLFERLEQVLDVSRQIDCPMAMLVIDLNQFKEINDTLGHHSGDRLLQQVAPRLEQALRETDTIARLGGDEFAIILPETGSTGAMRVSKKIIKTIDRPFAIEGHSLKVGVSIGIATYPEDGKDGDALLQKADVAMYVAKKDNSGYAVYDPERDQHSLNRLMIIGQLHDAIKKDELVLHYQPIINLKNNSLWGCEVLVRWNHPELGLLEPDEFIAIAEQSGVVKDLTSWVINKALSQFGNMLNIDPELNLSINLSVQDIQDAAFVGRLSTLLEKHGIKENNLHLEITESSMMTDSQRAHAVLAELDELGVSLAIDDFGTGFSSLAYLKQLPARIIKIDKTFVRDIFEDDNDAVIVRSTIDLAHNMGRVVVAEGVENRDTLDILEILRCDYVQGNHISPPLAIGELLQWINNHYGISKNNIYYL